MLILKYKRVTTFYALLVSIYLLEVVLFPTDKSVLIKYHLTTLQAKLLSLSVALPSIIIWFVALLAFLGLYHYSKTLNKTRAGKAFKTLSIGVFFLSIWLPLSAILSEFITNTEFSNPNLAPNLTRLNNYFNLVALSIGFYIIYIGTLKLLILIKKHQVAINHRFIISYIIFSALYVFLTLHDSTRAVPTQSVHFASYYESDWLIVVTLVIPRLINWYIGIQAAYNIYIYRSKVVGSLYKEALKYISLGLIFIITMTVILRSLESLNGALANFGLGLLVVIIYLLLMLISVGYIFIVLGVKKLQKIEEV